MRVGNLIKISKGKKEQEVDYSEESDRYIQIEDLRSNSSLKSCIPHAKSVYCKPSDLLIAWDGANAGTVGFGLKGVIGSTIAKLTPVKEVHTPYFGSFLQSKFRYLRDNCTGATIPHISKSSLERLEIPLPSLPTQRKIAEALDKADAIRKRSKKILTKYDQLVQSVFLEMFGDPVKNEKGWEVKTISSVCSKIYGGGTPSKDNSEFYTGEVPWVTPKDMKVKLITTSIDKITEEAVANSSAKWIPTNSVLMVIRSGILKKKLPIAINSVPVTVNQDLKAFIPHTRVVNTNYLYSFFQSVEKFLLGQVRAVTADNIEFKRIQNLNLPVPPLAFQNQFASIIEQIEKQKAQTQSELDRAEMLYQSLLQRAFTGELDFGSCLMS